MPPNLNPFLFGTHYRSNFSAHLQPRLSSLLNSSVFVFVMIAQLGDADARCYDGSDEMRWIRFRRRSRFFHLHLQGKAVAESGWDFLCELPISSSGLLCAARWASSAAPRAPSS